MTDKVGQSILAMGWATLAMVWVAMAWGVYCLYWPVAGMTMKPHPFTFESKTVAPGTVAVYDVRYCVDSSLPLPVTVSRELVLQAPEAAYPIAPPLSYVITQRCETKRFLLGIAAYIPPGPYRLLWHTALGVNPLRTIHQTFESEPFEVVAK